MKTSWFAKFMQIRTLSFMMLTVGLQSAPAYALPATDPPLKQKVLECFDDLQGTLSISPSTCQSWADRDTTLERDSPQRLYRRRRYAVCR